MSMFWPNQGWSRPDKIGTKHRPCLWMWKSRQVWNCTKKRGPKGIGLCLLRCSLPCCLKLNFMMPINVVSKTPKNVVSTGPIKYIQKSSARAYWGVAYHVGHPCGRPIFL